MPKVETIEQFIAMVEANEHDKAIEKFYTTNASMQENQAEPRLGRDNLVANEKNTLLKVKSLISKCIRPYFINGDQVVIQWYFRFEWKNGTVSEIEEMAWQNWQGELIQSEKFFYDSKQFSSTQ
ncbi:hypothetical protein D3C85_403810 [compost metagenome]